MGKLTSEKVLEWVHTAKPNDRLEYHHGHLMLKVSHPDRRELFDTLMLLSEKHKIMLLQERRGEDDYIYYAVRQSKEFEKCGGFRVLPVFVPNNEAKRPRKEYEARNCKIVLQ